ncbi:MAG: hypothetical protein U5Q44_12185 [Dehalococcoidia bacterium]|nr:hypothetical protein [Dehalococcoidia bacterium]
MWQLYAVFLVVMPLAWACLGPVAISAAVGPWFSERRGTAMTIALTGPSFGGMLVVPALVLGGETLGSRPRS